MKSLLSKLNFLNQTKTVAYPDLAAIIGGQTPDYRGLFLRGVGGNSASIGVHQGDAIRNINGYMGSTQYAQKLAWPTPSFYPTGVFFNDPAFTFKTHWFWQSTPHPSCDLRDVFLDVSLMVPTSNENRPVNRAVRYLIRALE